MKQSRTPAAHFFSLWVEQINQSHLGLNRLSCFLHHPLTTTLEVQSSEKGADANAARVEAHAIQRLLIGATANEYAGFGDEAEAMASIAYDGGSGGGGAFTPADGAPTDAGTEAMDGFMNI